jgi:hypothetical protein
MYKPISLIRHTKACKGENMHWIYAHLIGDYIIQNDWMALGKKNKSWICAVHVLAYLVPFLFCGFTWWQLLAIGVQHFVQDRTNIVVWLMKVKGSGGFISPPCGPWSIIVTDNIIHILFMAWISAL